MPTDRPAAGNSRAGFSLLLTIAGVAGIPGAFLPFTWNTSPLDAARTLPLMKGYFGEGLWALGVPLLLAVPVAAASIRWHLARRLSRLERVSAYLMALVALCCFLCIYLSGENPPSSFSEWSLFAFGLAAPAVGASLLFRNRRRGVPLDAGPIAAMQMVYVTVAIFCLGAFGHERWQIGAYLVALTTAAYLAQIVAVSVAGRARSLDQ